MLFSHLYTLKSIRTQVKHFEAPKLCEAVPIDLAKEIKGKVDVLCFRPGILL